MISPELLVQSSELASIGLLLHALAFSKPVRKLIGKRDHWQCQEETCDKQFKDGWMVHASHFNHDREDPAYDEPESGDIRCVFHHLLYHLLHKGKAEEIGLDECQNDFAISMLSQTNERVKK